MRSLVLVTSALCFLTSVLAKFMSRLTNFMSSLCFSASALVPKHITLCFEDIPLVILTSTLPRFTSALVVGDIALAAYESSRSSLAPRGTAEAPTLERLEAAVSACFFSRSTTAAPPCPKSLSCHS